MSKLYINDKEIQLPENFEVSFTIQLSDASDPSAVKNNYSQNVTVEATPQNTEVLGLFFEFNATTGGNAFNPKIRNSFTLLDDNCNVFQTGYCKMISATTKGKKTEYTLALYGLLGDFFYNLKTDDFGEEMNLGDLLYKPFDYPDENGNIDDWSDVVWNARYLRGLSNYLERTDGNKRFRANKGIGYCFTDSGLYPDFDNNKVVLGWMNKGSDPKYNEFRSYIPPIKQEFNGGTLVGNYLPYIYNNQAYTLLEYNQDLKDYELDVYCAHYMRPTFYLPMVLEACSNPDNNGGYEVEWDETILDSLEYQNAWLLFDRFDFNQNRDTYNLPAVIDNKNISVSDWATTNVAKKANPNPDNDWYFVYNCTSMRYPSLFTRPLAFLEIDNTVKQRISSGYIPALNGQVTRSYTVDTNRIYMGGMIVEVEAYDYYTNEVYATDYRFLTTNTLLLSESNNMSMINVIDPTTHQGNNTVYGKAYNVLLAMILGQIGFDKQEKYLSINRNIYTNFRLDSFFGFEPIIPDSEFLSTVPFELNLPWKTDYIWGEVPNNCSTLSYRLKTRWINITYDVNTQEYSWSFAPRLMYKDPSTSVLFYVPKKSVMLNSVEKLYNAYPTDELTNAVYNSYGDTPFIKGLNYNISKEFFFRNTKPPLEYLLSYTKMSNFKYIVDNLNKKIKIVTSETFYENKELVDLSDMVDYSKEIKVEPYIYDCKWLNYTIDTPGKTGWQWSETINTNTNFNNNTKDILNNNIYQNVTENWFSSNIGNSSNQTTSQIIPALMWPANIKETLYNSLDNNEPQTFELNGIYARPFESQHSFSYGNINCKTPSGENNSDINNAVIYYRPTTNSVKEKVYDTLPVTMELNKKPCHFFPLNDTDIDGDNVLQPLYDCFEGRVYEEWVNFEGYYKKYWETTIEQFVDPDCKRVTLYTRLPADIQQNELLRRFYFFNDSVWILEKIENYTNTSDKPLKCTFIKIKDHQRFGKIIDLEYNVFITNG